MEKKTKIYLVTSGSYSDYKVNGVFSTEQKAKHFIDLQYFSAYDYPQIETMTLDRGDEIPEGFSIFSVKMTKKGKVTYADKGTYEELSSEPRIMRDYSKEPEDEDFISLFNTLVAKTLQQAIKKTNELRSQMIATNNWDKQETEIRKRMRC